MRPLSIGSLHLLIIRTGLVGEIIARFEKRGFKLVALKMVTASKEHLEEHYGDLKEKAFFPGLVKYMASGASTWCSLLLEFTLKGIAQALLSLWSGKERVSAVLSSHWSSVDFCSYRRRQDRPCHAWSVSGGFSTLVVTVAQ